MARNIFLHVKVARNTKKVGQACIVLCVSALANLSTPLSRRGHSYIVDTLLL